MTTDTDRLAALLHDALCGPFAFHDGLGNCDRLAARLIAQGVRVGDEPDMGFPSGDSDDLRGRQGSIVPPGWQGGDGLDIDRLAKALVGPLAHDLGYMPWDEQRPEGWRWTSLAADIARDYAALAASPAPTLDEACIGDPSHQYHSHDDDPEDAPAPTETPERYQRRANEGRAIEASDR